MGSMTDDRVYTLVQAARVAGVSLPTVRRRKDQLIAAGAVVDAKGWRVPHSALEAAFPGLSEPQEPRERVVEAEPLPVPTEELRVTQDRVRRLESENLVLRAQLDKWETVARERLDALNDQRMSFRALVMTRPQELEQQPASQQVDEPRPGWWKRTFG